MRDQASAPTWWSLASQASPACPRPGQPLPQEGRCCWPTREALVASGGLLLVPARQSGGRVLPIDSEHNAAYRCANGLAFATNRAYAPSR